VHIRRSNTAGAAAARPCTQPCRSPSVVRDARIASRGRRSRCQPAVSPSVSSCLTAPAVGAVIVLDARSILCTRASRPTATRPSPAHGATSGTVTCRCGSGVSMAGRQSCSCRRDHEGVRPLAARTRFTMILGAGVAVLVASAG
jgi:hypothetical protein